MQPSRADSRAYVARGARQNGAMGLNTCLKSDPTNNLSRRAHADTSIIFIQIGPTPLGTEISLVFVASFPSSLSYEHFIERISLTHSCRYSARFSHALACHCIAGTLLLEGFVTGRAGRGKLITIRCRPIAGAGRHHCAPSVRCWSCGASA